MPIAVMMEFQREHHIDDDDLDDYPEEGTGFRRASMRFATRVHLVVNFVGRLGDQEQSATDQDDIAP